MNAVAHLEAPYFICYLQREADSQILSHSQFESIAASYETILENFGRAAPPELHLVLKNHPLDPALVDHEKNVTDLSRKLGIEQRIHFIRGGNLAALTRASRGAVTVNSTAGISSVQFGVPTKTLGRAIYDIEGLTDQAPLSDFWKNPRKPDGDLFRAFRSVVMHRTQINGSFYAPQGRALAISASVLRLTDRGGACDGASAHTEAAC